ncbi:MAG: biotin--[acetyl-CoA-carboxylase] ligase [Lactobacillales bacterium]|jgi:BirA family biotin operon repressor/biotin-[acetyl-CoA-carboxylase] ligase|nr:biotin--[acetyl-CoA-carboxylase] ligase [Lactobacillales bacterium]
MKKDYLTMKWTLHFFETLESTNDTAKAYPIGSVIIADIQTGGKGRNGRMWQSPKGNLFLSAVLPDYGDLTPYLSFLAGVAVVEALPEWPLKLKWPNDVLLDGKKICGILLEREENKVIMGIGINVSTLPTGDFLYRVGCLKGALSLEKVRERVLISLSENLKEFEESGFAGIY